MTLPKTNESREYKKFRESQKKPGFTSVAVDIENKNENAIPVTTLGVVWNSLQVVFPQSNQDLFKYFYDNNLVLEVLVTYENQSKKQIIAIDKEVFNVEI
jgi:hypothetical protein